MSFKQIAQNRDIAAMKEKIKQEEIDRVEAEAAEAAAQEAAEQEIPPADEVRESHPDIDVTSVEDVTPGVASRNETIQGGKIMSKSSLKSPSH